MYGIGINRGLEYHNKYITKLFGGNARIGCYALAITIFSLGIFRDYLYVHPSPFPDNTILPESIQCMILTLTRKKLQRSSRRTTNAPHSSLPAVQTRSRPALPHRQHPRPNLDVCARRHGHLPRRLLRHPNGRTRYIVPVQCFRRTYVPWLDVVVPGYSAVVRKASGHPADRRGGHGIQHRKEMGGPVHRHDLCEERRGEEEGKKGLVESASLLLMVAAYDAHNIQNREDTRLCRGTLRKEE